MFPTEDREVLVLTREPKTSPTVHADALIGGEERRRLPTRLASFPSGSQARWGDS